MKRLIFLAVLLSACGSHKGYVEPELQPYVDEFHDVADVPVVHIDVVFTEDLPTSNTIGRCENGRVLIRRSYWLNTAISDRRKRSLVFHELGHCALFLKHDDALQDDGCHTTHMSTYAPSDRCLKKHEDEYDDKLHRYQHRPNKG